MLVKFVFTAVYAAGFLVSAAITTITWKFVSMVLFERDPVLVAVAFLLALSSTTISTALLTILIRGIREI